MKYIFLLFTLTFQLLFGYAQNLNVASYNIRQINKNDIGNLWSDRKDVVTDLIKFHDFDIFGIQEAFHEQMIDMQNNLSDYSYIGVGRDNGAKKGEYSAIFYKKNRFKLIKEGTFWLSDQNTEKPNKGWDAALPRICTWGIFQDKSNGKKFILMNTHFDHIGTVARTESAKLILQKAEELAKKLPLLLTGDFNIDQNNEAYFTLAKSGIVEDAYDKAPLKYIPNSTFNGWGKSIKKDTRIDHIFVSKQFDVLKYGILTDTYMGKFTSDHFPVFVQLKWK